MKFDMKGVITALVTPFKNAEVDFKSLRRLVRDQLEKGIEGFVVNGTTAESPTLTPSEVKEIFQVVQSESDKKVPLIVGTGSNSTQKTIEATLEAKAMGADAALIVTPYYNKPPQRGLILHYQQVAKAADLPIILYNVPGRTGVSMTAETVTELSKEKNIIGIKEATGDLKLGREIREKAGSDFLLISGDDFTCMDLAAAGGSGVISVTSHVIPSAMVTLLKRARQNDLESLKEYQRYSELNRLLFVEANPIPVKSALHMLGIIDSPELRLPLVELADSYKRELSATMKRLGVLK